MIAPETGMIVSQSQWRNQKNASYNEIFPFKLTTKLSTTARHRSCRQEGKEPRIDIACPFDHRVSLKEQERSNTKT